MRGRAVISGVGGLIGLAAVLGAAACGGEKGVDISEPSRQYTLDVTRAEFPAKQHVTGSSDLVLAVRNAGEAVPNLAITLWTETDGSVTSKPGGSFNVQLEGDTASATQVVWTPDERFPKLLGPGTTLTNVASAAPSGAEAAQTDTFVFGELRAGETKTVVWRVVPVRAGRFSLNYEVAAGVSGNSKVVAGGGGGELKGVKDVTIKASPRDTCIVTERGASGDNCP